MASKFAKRAAMRKKYTAPVTRQTLTYASQTMKNWMGQIDPLTQASIGDMTQEVKVSAAPATVFIDLSGIKGAVLDAGTPRGGGFQLGDGPIKDGSGGNVGGGTVVVGPGAGTEKVTNCHTHTMTDWTGLGEQYLNGVTSQAIGTPDGHTHLVVAGQVQPVSSIQFPNVPVHTHTSLTEI